MTKINIRIPEPKQEYDVSNQKQINRAKKQRIVKNKKLIELIKKVVVKQIKALRK